MTPIEIINKTGGGRRDTFTQSPVTFGRDPGNNVVVGGSVVSRHHGQLTEENGAWRLTVASANGAEVNGKRIGRTGRVLRDKDVVSVGGEVVFEVHLASGLATAAGADAAADGEENAPKRRSRVWLWIGIYLLLMLGLFVFLATLRKDKETTVAAASELTRQQITESVRSPLPTRPLDERKATDELKTAREIAERLDAAVDARYRAYMAYREALASSGKRVFDEGRDQRRYMDLQTDLIDQIVKQYSTAYEKLRSGQFNAAAEGFRVVTLIFPDPDSLIHKNAEMQRKVAVENFRKQRSRQR